MSLYFAIFLQITIKFKKKFSNIQLFLHCIIITIITIILSVIIDVILSTIAPVKWSPQKRGFIISLFGVEF